MSFKKVFAWQSLIRQLILKNLKLRYSTTNFGFFWAFLSPLLTALIYYFIFSKILKFAVPGVPFFFYLISGIFPWQFFQLSVVQGATSFMDNRNLIQEARFPRYIIPLSVVLTNALIFLPPLILLSLISLVLFKTVSFFLLFLPVLLLFYSFLTFAASVTASIVSLKWRDLPHFLEIFLTLLFYWAPVVYPISLAHQSMGPAAWKFYVLNPFVTVISLFRLAWIPNMSGLIKETMPMGFLFGFPAVFSIAALLLALAFYRKYNNWVQELFSV